MLHDVTGGYQAYIQRNIYLLCLEFGNWLRPRAVGRLRARFARDKIIKSLRSELMSGIQIFSLSSAREMLIADLISSPDLKFIIGKHLCKREKYFLFPLGVK